MVLATTLTEGFFGCHADIMLKVWRAARNPRFMLLHPQRSPQLVIVTSLQGSLRPQSHRPRIHSSVCGDLTATLEIFLDPPRFHGSWWIQNDRETIGRQFL